MGKRRIRNLLKLGYKQIIGFDPREDRRKEVFKKYHMQTVSNLEEAFAINPDVMIISTPPDLHFKYAKIAIKKNINFFTEVNLFSNEIREIVKKIENKLIVGVPSSTMIYHPVTKKLKKILDQKTIGKILTVYHHFGHYLPNWHPWEDYRNFYVSKRETGGAREIIPFELVWLTYLFSEIKSVYGNINKISALDNNIDDIYQIMIEFKNGIQCILVVDVISQPSFSETKIIGERGSIICDFNKGTIQINKGNGWKNIQLKIDKVAKGYKGNTPPESLYEEEMQNLLDIINKKKKHSYSFSDELKILRILDAVETSNKEEKKIIINKDWKS